MKLGVCVPYRNREEHMNQFVPHLSNFLDKKGIDHTIYIVHQRDEFLFNRGLMKNIGAKQAFDDGCDYIVWHDIDMIPEDDTCDYSYPGETPKHIAVQISQSDYQLKYQEYFGGALSKDEVSMLHKEYSTNGLILHYNFDEIVEDRFIIDQSDVNDGILNNVEIVETEIQIPHTILPHRRDGKFFCLPHETEGLINVNGIDKWAKGETTAANERRYVLEMQLLHILDYNLLSNRILQFLS